MKDEKFKQFYLENNEENSPFDFVGGEFILNNSLKGGLRGKLTGVKMSIGERNNIFIASEKGISLGNADFDKAPFSVDMAGNAVINSVSITGGSVKYGKTSFADSTNAGYYLGSEGIYFGSALDTTKLKYAIATGAFDFIGTVSGRDSAVLAAAINAAGNLVNDLINTKINTNSKAILADFDFGAVDYAGALKSGDLVWNTTTGAIISGSGIAVYRNGIVGAQAGVATFTIGTDGSAYFSGEIAASDITGGTVTGATLNVNGDAIRLRDALENQVGYLYGGSSTELRLIAATSLAGGGSIDLLMDASSTRIKCKALYFEPTTDAERTLGDTDKAWKDIYGYNLRMTPQASAPTGAKGSIYANTDGKIYYHNGTDWGDLTGGGGVSGALTDVDTIEFTGGGWMYGDYANRLKLYAPYDIYLDTGTYDFWSGAATWGTGRIMFDGSLEIDCASAKRNSGTTIPNAGYMELYAGPGDTVGHGGYIHLRGGSGGATTGRGGHVKIDGGNGYGDSQRGGDIYMEAGSTNGSGDGGYITIESGTSATGDDGYIQITSALSVTIDAPTINLDGYVNLLYTNTAPTTPANGMIWMESDGLHIYYNGAEKLVAGS